jgi:NAD(P)-dependent dehydrogenase (short-subunit alcohol dehydrogenase family)
MNQSKRFENQVVLVTGGNSGIGFATAKEFINEGARVIITGRDAKALAQATAELGNAASSLVNDASRVSDGAVLADYIQKTYGRLDAAFINAGVAKFGALSEQNEKTFDDTFDTNVKGPYFLIQKLAPLFKQGGSIVLNGSINAHIGMPGSSIYAASKAAFITFARTLSSELLPSGIRINVVSPGPVSTPLYGKLGLPTDALNQMAASIQSQIPLKRFGEPVEIAKTVLFLASKDSSFIIGAEIVADGGMIEL